MATPHYTEDSDTDTVDFGYFATTEEEEDAVDETAEPDYKYNAKVASRVFYPICIGEVLNERYRVDHKLGQGGFSTVWMACDFQSERNVALKVMASESGGSGDSGEHESYMQNEIRQNVQDASHLVVSLATFALPGRNESSSHQVLVLPLMGPHFDSIYVKRLSMSTRMSAARQLLGALKSLHKGGIVHRDLNDRNCMWGITPIHHLSRAAKYKLLSRPLKLSMWYINIHKQGERVKPITISDYLRTESFYLGDFGQAMKLGGERTQQLRPPLMYCSPDRLHNRAPSFACDMWSYMCIFAEFCLGFVPFPSAGVISSMVDTLGPLPEEWKGSYVDAEGSQDMWYDPNTKPSPECSLKARIEKYCSDRDPVERQHVLSILTRGVQLLSRGKTYCNTVAARCFIQGYYA